MAAQPGLRLRLQATPTSLGLFRQALRDWLQQLGLEPGDVFDVVLACSECLTLVTEDRPRQVALVVDVAGAFDGERVVVTVRDYGLWHKSHALDQEEPLGLCLMRALMDSVELERRHGRPDDHPRAVSPGSRRRAPGAADLTISGTIAPMPRRSPLGLLGLAAVLACLTAAAAHAVTITRTIVLDRSIAGVGLGETRGGIESRIGTGSIVSARTDTSTRPPGHVERVAYSAAGLYVTYASAGVTPARLAAGKAVVLETIWMSFRTPQGVHVGSPLSAVRAIPGVRCFGTVCQHGYVG